VGREEAISARILLVDDEPRNLLVLEGCLGGLGHELIRATGGRQAIEHVEASPPDLILLDIAMPDVDGFDVLTHLRARRDDVHIPVIVVTAYADRDIRLRALEAGADEFLEKPIDRAILVARVKLLLRLHEMTRALGERRRQLEQLQQEQRELTAFIVHDIKNPLAVATMNVEWSIGEIAERTDLREALVESADAIVRVGVMVDDLLMISRLETSDLPLQRQPIAISELLATIARAHQRELNSKHIHLTIDEQGDPRVTGDPFILRRLFENLLENALRHTPENGRITLRAQTGTEVEVAVENTGSAIAPHDEAKIFDRYTRGTTASPSVRNMGLGLYFCRRAARLHGGDVVLHHSDSSETSFLVRLPAA
jgi:two-component system, sensor histidine kinase and response regulator